MSSLIVEVGEGFEDEEEVTEIETHAEIKEEIRARKVEEPQEKTVEVQEGKQTEQEDEPTEQEQQTEHLEEFEGVRLVRTKAKRPKTKLRPPTTLERVFGNRTSIKPHYFTAATNVNETNQRDVTKEVSPFKYPKDLELFAYKVLSKAWREDLKNTERNLKYNERHSHRTRQSLDKLRRLYVKEPEVKSMKTILDLDPQFFTSVEGRPVPQKFNRREYVQDIRDILRMKIVTGYREDEVMLIEESFINEQKNLTRIKEEFQKYVNTFEEFLFNDHTMSMALLRQAEQEASIATQKYEEYRELLKSYGSLKSVVYNLEEKWRHCKMYQKFLYLVSPMSWRRRNDYLHFKITDSQENVEVVETEQSDVSVFDRYKLGTVGEVLSLDNLIEQFLDDIKNQDEPKLFFEDPSQLLKVFNFIELQNLNSLLHSEELAAPMETVKESMIKAHERFEAEMTSLQETIDSLEGGIIWEEERAQALQELALELINSDFKEIISNNDVLSLHVFVEDLFESRIASNDSNLSMSQMMSLIELAYRNYLLQLDRLPDALVYKYEIQCYVEEARIMKIAKEAAKKVVQVERLMKHLARLLQPVVIRKHRELKWRSPPTEKIKKPPLPAKPLTAEETDYLTYFVEFCEHLDDPKEFGIRVHETVKKERSGRADVTD